MEDISVLNQILVSALGMGWLQWLAFIFGIAYVILAAKENAWCWPVGLISVVIAFFVYADPEVRLYSDAILQIFYAIISIYGWWTWTRNSTSEEPLNSSPEEGILKIHTWPIGFHLTFMVIGVVLAAIWGKIWLQFGAALPYIDAATTVFSLIATYMVTQKILENWLYWIVIDVVCIFVYLHRELYLFSIMFLIYTIVAVVGYYNWKKEYQGFSSNSSL